MLKIKSLFTKYGTPRNRKVLLITLSVIGLAIAGGAPGAGSGMGGGIDGINILLGF
jgi:hypothetical protein